MLRKHKGEMKEKDRRTAKYEWKGKERRRDLMPLILTLYLNLNCTHYSHRILRAASVLKYKEVGPGMSDNLYKATPSKKG